MTLKVQVMVYSVEDRILIQKFVQIRKYWC